MLKYIRIKEFVDKCGPNIWVCLFMCLCITLKQFNTNSLTTTNTFSCLNGREVTRLTAVPEVLYSMPGFDKGFVFAFWFRFCSIFTFWCKTLFVLKRRNSCYNAISFSIFNILQSLWQTKDVRIYWVFTRLVFEHT